MVDIQLPLVGRDAAIVLDGRRVGRVKRPILDHPWSEVTVLLEDEPITVVLTWHQVAPLTDVFVNGKSLRDGRAISEARRTAPTPLRGFDRWFATNIAGVAILRLAPVWLSASAVLSLAGVIAVFVWGLEGPGPGIVAGSGIMAIGFILIRTWLIVTARAHAYLMGRRELGDLKRTFALVSVFIGLPASFLGLFVAGALAFGS